MDETTCYDIQRLPDGRWDFAVDGVSSDTKYLTEEAAMIAASLLARLRFVGTGRATTVRKQIENNAWVRCISFTTPEGLDQMLIPMRVALWTSRVTESSFNSLCDPASRIRADDL